MIFLHMQWKVSLRVSYRANWPAAWTILPVWFDCLVESFPYEEVQFNSFAHLWKLVATLVKTFMKPFVQYAVFSIIRVFQRGCRPDVMAICCLWPWNVFFTLMWYLCLFCIIYDFYEAQNGKPLRVEIARFTCKIVCQPTLCDSTYSRRIMYFFYIFLGF